MCVICYIPQGVETPPYKVIKAMRIANPHGMGFCTPSQYRKSVANFEVFVRCLKRRSINEPCLIHFRLATHGSIKQENCHPFHDRKTGVYFAHNGILDIKPANDKTDSETAFRKRFLPIIKKYGFESEELEAEVNRIIGGSKFVFMQIAKTETKYEEDISVNVKMFGQFEEWLGCYFSNLRFTAYL